MNSQWNQPAHSTGQPTYMPRTRSTTEFNANNPTAAIRQSRSNPRFQEAEQPSPGGSSYTTADPYSPTVNNGYTADYSVSEVSSVTGSLGSFAIGRQPLAVHKIQASRYNAESGDSGNYSSQRARGYASSMTSYGETDLDSVTSDSRQVRPSNNDRFRGELFQPQPAPRTMIVERQVRRMYGEKHPRQLTKDELPTPSSGDELDTTASEASVPSFTDVPKVRPRSSLRRKKVSQANSAFFSDDDDGSVSSNLEKSKSLPRSILKNNSIDLSDADSLAKTSNFSRNGSRRSVRFEHRDKARDLPKKVTDYNQVDNNKDNNKKRKKSDPFDHIAPIGIKPARNDPKRSSGRSNSSRGSQKGNQKGRQARSSSSDRSRQRNTSGSANRSRSVSPGGKGQRNQSSEREKPQTNGQTRPSDEYSAALRGDEVRIEMPPPRKSMMGEILSQPEPANTRSGSDTQKMCKWCLIIGVPIVLIIIVVIVVVVLFTRGG